MRSRFLFAVATGLCLLAHHAADQPIRPGPPSVGGRGLAPVIRSPAPQDFVRPGLADGIYSQLRAEAQVTPTRLGVPIRRPPRPLAPYQPYATPPTEADSSKFNLRQIVVKFVEGSAIRLRGEALVVSSEPDALETQPVRLGRSHLEPQDVQVQLNQFNALVRKSGSARRPTSLVAELDLTLLRRRAEAASGLEQPDLNLFYFVSLKDLPVEQLQRLLADLRKLKIVETAYFQPIPHDAGDIPPPTFIDVTNSQGYFGPAPIGVDVSFARRFAGGRGEGVRIGDIEWGWNTSHEDFPSMAFGIGTNWGGDHGTAVIGELAALENNYGATGIAPNARVGWSGVTNLNPFDAIYIYSVASALLETGKVLRPGDIALIEQHFPNPSPPPCNPKTNPCGCGQWGYVAVETWPFEHASISNATAAGIVVVEAAGNGQDMVTPASTRDSGAIIVGASDSGGAGTPMCFTNFGPRVNVRAWGSSVGSLGFGDDASLQANGGDDRQWYTRSFSGTSSASPIVTGAAALIQGTRDAAGLAKLTPLQMRSLLVATGVPQSGGVAIGPQPDLRAAIATYIPDLAQFVRQTMAPASVKPLITAFVVKVTFKNTGAGVWTGDHRMVILPDPNNQAWPDAQQSFPMGSAVGAIMPSDAVTLPFGFNSPAQPGTYRLTFAVLDAAGRTMAVSPAQTIVVAAQNTPFDNATLSIAQPVTLPGNVGLLASVTATNTGTTTWGSTYFLRLLRNGRISLPNTTVPSSGSVAPGQSRTFSFLMTCNGSGEGGFSAQMSGSGGDFGQNSGITVVCP
jgi:hypothetical protein